MNPAVAILIRQLHAYFSMFIAPTLLFFAITGGLQVYSFHEDHGVYEAPAILAELAAVHKDQEFEAPHKRPPPKPTSGPVEPPHDKLAGLPPKVAVLKLFFALASVGLLISTCLGIWMALKYTRRPRLCLLLLVLGVVLPLLSFLLP